MQRKTEEGYGVTVLVANGEEICVVTPAGITNSPMLLQAIKDEHKQLPFARRGYKGLKVTFPVFLMFCSMDWQLHMMFRVEHRSRADQSVRHHRWG
jgi:hypothetical protein